MNQEYSASRVLRRGLLPAALLALAFVFALVPAVAHAGLLGDVTPPISVADVEASYMGSAKIVITAMDLPGGSVETSVVTGVKSINYKVDLGADVVSLGATATVNVTALGSHSVTFFATDNDGNVEAPKTGYFTVEAYDETPPTTVSDREAVYLDSGVITLTAFDDTGVDATYYILDGGTPTQGTEVAFDTYGPHTLSFWSVDLAGNAEAPVPTSFYVDDSLAPVTTSNAKPNYYDSHASITLTATDANGSGVAGTYYRLDGGADAVKGTVVTSNVVGAHSLAFWSEDVEGNVEGAKTATFTVNAGPVPGSDVLAPVSTSDAQATYATSPATVRLTSTDEDGGSGMKSLSYRVDGGATVVVTSTPTASALQALTQPITPTISSPATHHNGSGTATVNSCDCHTPNGCQECHDVAAAPDITTAATKPANHSFITVTPCTGCHVVTDVPPPPSSKSISKDVVVAGAGAHTIEFWGEDLAGNVETPHKTAAFTIGTPANTPPVLAPIGNKTVNELALLSFTATATDADGDARTFSLGAGAPAGASITSGGTFSWTPSEAQGPGSYPITVVVSDGTTTDSETFTITVNEVADTNTPPVLAPIGNKTVNELTLLSFVATATDADGDARTFSLGAGAPAGASITSGGTFSWTPSEAQGPGSYPITVVVSDGTTTDSETFTITVNEVADSGPTSTYLSVRFAETTASSYGIPYGASPYLTVQGVLVELDNTAIRVTGQTVDLWTSFDGSNYTKSSAAVMEDPGNPGLYSVRVLCTRRTWYRLRFGGSEDYERSLGRTLNAGPKAWLTAPVAPSTLSRTRSYSVYGYLKPRHYGSPVKIYAYQKIGGTWTVRASFLAKASNYSTYSRYAASIRLPYGGQWRIRAYHRDNAGGVHYASYSSWRYITVK